MQNMKLGLQLYNFRKELTADFKGTMRKIAGLGFDGVEFAGNYGEIPPEELALFLKELGLKCAGTMFQAEDILNPDSNVFAYAKALNSPAVTISRSGDFVKEYDRVLELCRRLGDAAAAQNAVFSYHNHWAEFALKEGVPVMNLLLQATDPAKVLLELDVCWLTRGGLKPAEYIAKFGSRIRQIHMKDIVVPEDPNTTIELGRGIIDLKGAYEAAKKSSCQWLIYEQDNTKLSAFESAKISVEYLKELTK